MPSIDQIINRQFRQWELDQEKRQESVPHMPPPPPIVTVSREHGSRGSYLAQRLAEELGYTRLHREIIDAICQSSGYRKHIVAALDEKHRSDVAMLVEGLLTGQAMHHTDYSRNLCSVVLSMAQLGGVILVGRAGSFILGPRRGFHIRLVLSVDKRIENLIKYSGVSYDDAAAAITRLDRERREMVRKMFNADIDDPHQYDLLLNGAYLDIEDMIPTCLAAIRGKTAKLLHTRA